jgi:pimeloyl-ACP methyl ester carboxylesterase
VLIHGLGGSRDTWDRVVPLIEPHARVLALNLSGSDSIEQEADLAAELIPRPAVLVGHSRGGLVATRIAQRHREPARKLIFVLHTMGTRKPPHRQPPT